MSAAYLLEGVAFNWRAAPVLQVPRLELAPGSVTALTGPNGSGKTTLLNLLAFLESPSAGGIRFFGAATPPQAHAGLRRRIAYLQQKPWLFRADVAANAEAGLRWRGVAAGERRERVRRALAEFDLGPLAARPAAMLSGGETQKLALARTLVLDAEVLLLDEPFNHLDAVAAARFEERLQRLREERRKTIVFSTHDVYLAQLLADRVCSMVEGQVLPLVASNVFRGQLAGDCFDTGRIRIHVAAPRDGVRHLAIDASQVVLSRAELQSSMRNNFPGTVQALGEQSGGVLVTVAAGELFRVHLTLAAVAELELGIGCKVWLSFKSSATHLF